MSVKGSISVNKGYMFAKSSIMSIKGRAMSTKGIKPYIEQTNDCVETNI